MAVKRFSLSIDPATHQDEYQAIQGQNNISAYLRECVAFYEARKASRFVSDDMLKRINQVIETQNQIIEALKTGNIILQSNLEDSLSEQDDIFEDLIGQFENEL